MEKLKEMFQMEFQQKNEEKLLQLQKENEESFSCYKEIRKRNKRTRKNNNGSSLNCKNNKKHFLKV